MLHINIFFLLLLTFFCLRCKAFVRTSKIANYVKIVAIFRQVCNRQQPQGLAEKTSIEYKNKNKNSLQEKYNFIYECSQCELHIIIYYLWSDSSIPMRWKLMCTRLHTFCNLWRCASNLILAFTRQNMSLRRGISTAFNHFVLVAYVAIALCAYVLLFLELICLIIRRWSIKAKIYTRSQP